MSDKHEEDCLCLDCANQRTLATIDPAPSELACTDLLASLVARIRQRIGEEIIREEKMRDFFVGHYSYAKAGWNELRKEGLVTALGCIDVALSDSPKTAHLQSDANAELSEQPTKTP